MSPPCRACVLFAGLLLGACQASVTSPRPSDVSASAAPTSASGAQIVRVTDLAATERAQGREFASLVEASSLEAGLYLLAGGATDRQSAHDRDEVYVVVAGTARLVVGDAPVDVVPGSVAFVRAGTPHHFEAIVAELQVVVIFANGTPDAADPPYEAQSFAPDAAGGEQNSWQVFLERTSLRMGAYRLPVTGGGDAPQTHAVDEINVVLAGSGAFVVADDPPAEIGPGSVMYVPAGQPHAFARPDEDLLVLILFPAA